MLIRHARFALLILVLLESAPTLAADVPLDAMLGQMKNALVLVAKDSEVAALPPLKTATLNATTVQKKVQGGTFKLFIIEIGHTHTSELTTNVSITLAPPKGASLPVAAQADVAKQLAAAILSAAHAVSNAGKSSPPLIAKEIKASIKFGVTSDNQGKITFTFAPAEIGINGDASGEATQEIEIVYGS